MGHRPGVNYNICKRGCNLICNIPGHGRNPWLCQILCDMMAPDTERPFHRYAFYETPADKCRRPACGVDGSGPMRLSSRARIDSSLDGAPTSTGGGMSCGSRAYTIYHSPLPHPPAWSGPGLAVGLSALMAILKNTQVRGARPLPQCPTQHEGAVTRTVGTQGMIPMAVGQVCMQP